MHYFSQTLKKDKKKLGEVQELYRAQFAKALYNIGMIYDRLGDIQKASTFYKKAIDKCQEDQQQQKSQHMMKAMTNYAVTLEKLGMRQQAIQVFEQLQKSYKNEIRIFNNLGIIHKRNGNTDAAEINYRKAIELDGGSFFPNYNMGVLKA